MISNEIEINVKQIFENFSKEDFIFDLLPAYGISKTSITRLKNEDFNLSKTKGEILYKKKVFFKEEATGSLLSTIDSISKDERILKHKPRFAMVTVCMPLHQTRSVSILVWNVWGNDKEKYFVF